MKLKSIIFTAFLTGMLGGLAGALFVSPTTADIDRLSVSEVRLTNRDGDITLASGGDHLVIRSDELILATVPDNGLIQVILHHITDGDTFTAYMPSGELERIRLIGIDTPELHPLEPGAEAATARLAELLDGEIFLELGRQERDQYGRLLAWVFVDGVLVNAELLRDGIAELMIIPPNTRHIEELRVVSSDG